MATIRRLQPESDNLTQILDTSIEKNTFSGVVYDHWIPNFQAFRPGSAEVCAVVGPTCDSFDKVSLSVHLPPDLQIGDCLYTENIGAYSIASSTRFNGIEGAKILHLHN